MKVLTCYKEFELLSFVGIERYVIERALQLMKINWLLTFQQGGAVDSRTPEHSGV